MTRDTRLLLLLILLMVYGLFVVEGRRRLYEDAANDPRHRHRHGHESSGSRRNRHELADRRSSWSRELSYESGPPADRVDEEEEEEEEEEAEKEDDYDSRAYYKRERPYPRTPRIGAHSRVLESRYPPRYHRGGYRGTGWHYEDDERLRGSSRRQRRFGWGRPHRRLDYSRNRETYYDFHEEDESNRPNGRDYGEARTSRLTWRGARRHKVAGKYERRPDGRTGLSSEDRGVKERYKDEEVLEEEEEEEVQEEEEEEEEAEEEEEEEDVSEDEEDVSWNGTEDRDPTEEDEELDNDFYKNEKPPLKTFDDIIRRLTTGDSTTLKPSTKRYYRNTEKDRLAKRGSFANFEYESRNLSRPPLRDRDEIPDSFYVNDVSGHRSSKKLERKSPGTSSGVAAKTEDPRTKTKSLEQDYGKDANAPDDERKDDLAKGGAEENVGMQSDVTNTVSSYALANSFSPWRASSLGRTPRLA